MVKKITYFILVALGVVLLGSALMSPEAIARGDGVPDNLAAGDDSIIRRAINLMLYAVGVISVIMLIYGGFRYVVSGGQKESVTAAKNTILYAIVGLLIAIFAYAIVKFVIGAVVGTDSSTDI